MNIVIVGDGKVGYTLAEYLSGEDHDVVLIDRNAEALSKAGEALDVMTVHGNGANARILVEAGVGKADIFIAVTTNDETNMVCCLMSKQLGAGYAIARIRNPEYTESLDLFRERMGIDLVINPERATALEISRLLRFPSAINIETFAQGRVEIVEFRVNANDGIAGIPLREFNRRYPKILVCAAQRGGEAYIPDGSFVIQVGDRLHVAGDLKMITFFFKQLEREVGRVRRAMLIGGGRISYYLAQAIADMGIEIKIVEIDRGKCTGLAEELTGVEIVCGDGTDPDVLLSENLPEMGALICLTDRDEENLLTGLHGVRSGVGKVIVKVNRLNYLDLLGDTGIDCVVAPKRTVSSQILRMVRALSRSKDSAAIEKLYRMVDNQIDALEFTASEGAAYLGRPIKDLKIKENCLVAMIVHDRKAIIPFGNDRIRAGDTVLMIVRANDASDLDELLE